MKPSVQALSAGAVMTTIAGALVAWPPSPGEGPTATVRRGAFAQTIAARGAIDAARVRLYGSTIAGAQAKVLDLAPEGQPVAAGDVLIRFDAAPFEDAVLRETGALAQAEAEAVRARADLELEQMRSEAEIAGARAQIEFAEAALAYERDGRGLLIVAEAEAAAADAARQVQRAAAAVEDLKALLANGFATRAELDRTEQTLREAEERRSLATMKLQAVKTFEQPAALEKSRAEASAARTALTAAADAVQARLAHRRASVALAVGRVNDARQRLEHARAQVERCTVRAETAGLVVYRELFFGTDKRKPQPGDEVWPNQPLVAIPDPAQLVVETRVRETDLHGVSRASAVAITVDAFPDLAMRGEVAVVGALAQDEPGRAGKKFFPVTIRVSHPDDRLRTGMTARVELTVASIPDALLVPLDAVVEEDGDAWCEVVAGQSVERRAIEVLGRDEQVAAIRGRIAEGEVVRLLDRAGRAGDDRR